MILVELPVKWGVDNSTLTFVSTLSSCSTQFYSPKLCLLLLCSPPPHHVGMYLWRGLLCAQPQTYNYITILIRTNDSPISSVVAAKELHWRWIIRELIYELTGVRPHEMNGSDEQNSSKHDSRTNGSPRAFGRAGVRALWERAELETGCVLAHLDLHILLSNTALPSPCN